MSNDDGGPKSYKVRPARADDNSAGRCQNVHAGKGDDAGEVPLLSQAYCAAEKSLRCLVVFSPAPRRPIRGTMPDAAIGLGHVWRKAGFFFKTAFEEYE
ncbi:uncharacterized protein PgNI_07096 [Pyricularia grisea]|uniref:Uncharacterized protein n=1 Tax=Pyricularia grisea TaxID=148305 RepID=A0A6P8B3C4_PYRGI|nr:uncharacterized protein PgNI_07096 [Pyricularia grisea]TLD09415.1 hypothetical protein PgNI_07096 [Pyricularia grisea]